MAWNPINLGDFCYFFSLQVGVIVMSCMGFTVMCVVLVVNSIEDDPEKNQDYRFCHGAIVFGMCILGFVSYICGLFSAYRLSAKLSLAAGIINCLIFIMWLVVLILSFQDDPEENRLICIDNRCADRLFIQDAMWRRYGKFGRNETHDVGEAVYRLRKTHDPPPIGNTEGAGGGDPKRDLREGSATDVRESGTGEHDRPVWKNESHWRPFQQSTIVLTVDILFTRDNKITTSSSSEFMNPTTAATSVALDTNTLTTKGISSTDALSRPKREEKDLPMTSAEGGVAKPPIGIRSKHDRSHNGNSAEFGVNSSPEKPMPRTIESINSSMSRNSKRASDTVNNPARPLRTGYLRQAPLECRDKPILCGSQNESADGEFQSFKKLNAEERSHYRMLSIVCSVFISVFFFYGTLVYLSYHTELKQRKKETEGIVRAPNFPEQINCTIS